LSVLPEKPRSGVVTEGAVEAVASNVAIWLGDELLRRAGLESAPQRLWSKPGFDRTREEAAWLKGRDDTVAFIQDELEGGIRRALEGSPAYPAILKDLEERLVEDAYYVEQFLKKVLSWQGSDEEELAEAIESAEKLCAALDPAPTEERKG
jgi:hypothetical protein